MPVTDEGTAGRISERKLEHLEFAAAPDAEGPVSAGWHDVRLVHDCLPEMDIDEVDLTTSFLGQRLAAPVWITGMTGGHPRAAEINANLARAAERHGLAMGVGSQRAAIVAPDLVDTYRAARMAAPGAVLIANIGVPQLIPQRGSPALTVDEVRDVVDTISAQALAIHLNFLQEVVQPEGDRDARGCLDAIRRVVEGVDVPVLVKETGAGINRRRALQLKAAGVAAIDVAGAGGTSMARVEARRAQRSDPERVALAHAFDSWGIPTAAAVLETRHCGLPVAATGGIRNGVDAAKALALGATVVGVGRPFLLAALEGENALDRAVRQLLEELRIALFLTGSRTPSALRGTAVLLGELRAWAEQRGGEDGHDRSGARARIPRIKGPKVSGRSGPPGRD